MIQSENYTPAELKSREPRSLSRSEALPCPFCGQQPTIQPWHGGGPRKRLVTCPANEEGHEPCWIIPSACESTRARALAAWNYRGPQ